MIAESLRGVRGAGVALLALVLVFGAWWGWRRVPVGSTAASGAAAESAAAAPAALGVAGEDGSRPPADDAMTPASIYNARTLAEQDAYALRASGSRRYDALLAQIYGHMLCAERLGAWEKTITSTRGFSADRARASLRDLGRVLPSYCAGEAATPMDALWRDRLLASLAAEGDADATTLLEAMNLRLGEATPSDAQQRDIQSRLEDVLRTTRSPGMFMDVATELASAEWSPTADTFGYKQDVIQAGTMYGAIIAMCSEYAFCGPDSVFTLRACAPLDCPPGFSMDQWLRNQLTGEQYAAAQRYAEAYRAMRKR